jgi:hypothetical protein
MKAIKLLIGFIAMIWDYLFGKRSDEEESDTFDY